LPALAAVPDPPGSAELGRRAAPPFPESLRRGRDGVRSSPAAFLTAPESRPDHGPEPAPKGPRRLHPTEIQNTGWPADRDEGEDDEVELSADELAKASGLSAAAIGEMERYGLLKGAPGPGGRFFDSDALEVAKVAASFATFGVEPRHLKMWRNAADREAELFEQVVSPMRSQRGSKARRQAADAVTELADLGARLHSTLVTMATRRLL